MATLVGCRWRLQAEGRMRDSGKEGLTDDQVANFVRRFMPAYTAYLPGLYSKVCVATNSASCLIAVAYGIVLLQTGCMSTAVVQGSVLGCH